GFNERRDAAGGCHEWDAHRSWHSGGELGRRGVDQAAGSALSSGCRSLVRLAQSALRRKDQRRRRSSHAHERILRKLERTTGEITEYFVHWSRSSYRLILGLGCELSCKMALVEPESAESSVKIATY